MGFLMRISLLGFFISLEIAIICNKSEFLEYFDSKYVVQYNYFARLFSFVPLIFTSNFEKFNPRILIYLILALISMIIASLYHRFNRFLLTIFIPLSLINLVLHNPLACQDFNCKIGNCRFYIVSVFISMLLIWEIAEDNKKDNSVSTNRLLNKLKEKTD